MKRNFASIRPWAWLPLVLIALAAGCSQSGPERYRMSGNVTFDGKPVPAGDVQFEPTEKGIGGGFAPIKDGKYDTAVNGRGHLGGEHRVQVVGFDGLVDPSNPDSAAKVMFAPYNTTLDLPTKTTTKDFEVPADSKAPEVPVDPRDAANE